MTRTLSPYVDPLDQIWLEACRQLGLGVRRDASAYASSDGRGTLAIAPRECLDADDCLAQIILHELCHGLTEGEESFARPDWGLVCDEADAAYEEGRVREQACLRLQAALLLPYGLRRLLAPTTAFRAFYDALPHNPLGGDPSDSSIELARRGLCRARRAPFERVLAEALARTAVLHRLLSEALDEGSPPTLWRDARAGALHPTGLPMPENGPGAGGEASRCGDCAWRHDRRGGARCRRAEGVRIDPGWPACVLFETDLDCGRCAACCREAYDVVPLGRRERMARRHPELVERDGDGLRMRRTAQNACAALVSPLPGRFACAAYEDRPAPCRDLEPGGEHCLSARRRVGLSP